MTTPCKLLLLLCLVLLSTASSEGVCGTMAKTREAIPENALMPRNLLHMFYKLTRDDICKNSFQHLPASKFLLAEDMTIGTLLQQWAQTIEDFLWENWVRSYSEEKIKFKWNVDNMINHTLISLEKQVGFTIRDLKRNMDREINLTSNEMDAMIKNIFSFSKDDFGAFLEDLTCHFHGPVQHSTLENFIGADGVETINDDNLKELLQTSQKVALTETSNFLRNMVGKLRPLLEKFQPEMKAYEKTILQLQSGNTRELENLIFRILKEIRTDEFLQRLDTFVKDSCFDIAWYVTTFFLNILKNLEGLSKVIGSHVNNNKLDLQSLATQFNNKFGEIVKTRFNDIVDSRLADIEVGLKNGDYVVQAVYSFLPIVFPACNQFEKCQKEREVLIEQSDVLVGGAFRAFLKKFRIFRKPTKKGCSKNLFFDPEC